MSAENIRTVLLYGSMHFVGDILLSYKGPIKRGLRPIAWYSTDKNSMTSCSIISDVTIYAGKKKNIEVVLLNELQLGISLKKGMILNIGNTKGKFAEFTVEENLGIWSRIVP